MQSAFSSKTAFFISAKWRSRVKLVESIGPNNTCSHSLSHIKYFRAFICPYAGTQSIRAIICFFNHFIICSECKHRKHGPKNFFLSNTITLCNIGKNSRSTPKAFLGKRATAFIHFSTFLFTYF